MKCSQTCQQNAFPIKLLSFTVTLFRKCPPQNQTAAVHVQNTGVQQAETGSVKTKKRLMGKTNQGTVPEATLGCKLSLKYLSLYHSDKENQESKLKRFPDQMLSLNVSPQFEINNLISESQAKITNEF